MMADLRELYQQVLLDHSKRPRNFHDMPQATCRAEGFNALCGDRVTVFCKIHGNAIADVSFTGSGCAICTSSSSMMTQSLKGKNLKQARALFDKFHRLVTGQDDPEEAIENLDKLAVFSGVRQYPVRVKCATLPWHTMLAALDQREETVSTE